MIIQLTQSVNLHIIWVRIWGSLAISSVLTPIVSKWTSRRYRFLNRSLSKTIRSYEFIFHKQTSLYMNIHENNVLGDDSDDFDRFSSHSPDVSDATSHHQPMLLNVLLIWRQNHHPKSHHHQKPIFHFCTRNVPGTPGWCGKLPWEILCISSGEHIPGVVLGSHSGKGLQGRK